MEKEVQSSNKLKELVEDLTKGTISSAVAFYLTQPLDTIRVRMQIDPIKYNSVKQTIVRTVKDETVRGFYKGSASSIGCGVTSFSVYFLYF